MMVRKHVCHNLLRNPSQTAAKIHHKLSRKSTTSWCENMSPDCQTVWLSPTVVKIHHKLMQKYVTNCCENISQTVVNIYHITNWFQKCQMSHTDTKYENPPQVDDTKTRHKLLWKYPTNCCENLPQFAVAKSTTNCCEKFTTICCENPPQTDSKYVTNYT